MTITIMRSSIHDHSHLLITISFYLLLLSPVISCFNQYQQRQQPPISPPDDSVSEEKTRLGSRPPSCHNKCNGCHPCMAVQVPTLPSQGRVQQGSKAKTPLQFFDPYPPNNNNNNNRYSNYKPLGWRCRCGDHFYNP